MNSESILFSIGACDPSSKRAKGDARASVETVPAAGARQSETRTGRALLRHYRRKSPCPYLLIRPACLCLILSQNRSVRMVQNELKLL